MAGWIREGHVMVSLQVSLSENLLEFIEAQAAKEGLGSADNYVRNLIQQARQRQAKRDLEDQLLEGLQGPFEPIAEDEWVELRREIIERSPELGDTQHLR